MACPSVSEPLLAAETHWDIFYASPAKPNVAEYMLPYSRLARYLRPQFLRVGIEEARFLVVGCGISALGEELYDEYSGRMKEVMNVDISPHCVEHLRRRNLTRPRMRFAVEDMSGSSLPSRAYDVAVDKGVLDDVLAFDRCAADGDVASGTSDAGERSACAMVWEVRRVLVPDGGVYLVASVHGPSRLCPLLESEILGFDSVDHFELGMGEVGHHLYVCRTGGLLRSTCEATFEHYVADVLHKKYTEVMPLLTQDRRAAVTAAFASKGSSNPAGAQLLARDAYDEVFSAEERQEYLLDDFLEDLAAYFAQEQRLDLSLDCSDDGAGDGTSLSAEYPLSCEMVLDFLRATQ